MFRDRVESVKAECPLVHNITNYVTVHDVANALIACGASPIMTDEPDDVEDIASICDALNINIGTLNQNSIRGMVLASAKAEALGHPIVLDPVGAGASRLRTQTAVTLLEQRKIACVRANMSEIKALATGSSSTRGVDVAAADVVTHANVERMAAVARDLSRSTGAIVAVSGAIDLVSDAEKTYAVYNGHPLMGKITGSGCMLSGIVAAYLAANPGNELEAAAAAFCMYGLSGKLAAERALRDGVGNATYSNYLIDEVFKMDAETVERGAVFEVL